MQMNLPEGEKIRASFQGGILNQISCLRLRDVSTVLVVSKVHTLNLRKARSHIRGDATQMV